jgi:hypothetical protein
MQTDLPAIPPLKIKFWVFTILSILALLLIRYLSNGLSGTTVVDFEMAKSVEKAESIMGSWGSEGKDNFLNSIYADFIFLICYAGAFFYGSRFMGHLSGHAILKKAGYFFSFLALLAAICDVLENVAMLYTIKQEAIPWVVHFTYDMALVKFSLLFIVLLFMVIGLLFWVIDKLTPERKLKMKNPPVGGRGEE